MTFRQSGCSLRTGHRRLYKVQYPLDRVGRQRRKGPPDLQRYAEQIELDWLNLAALAFKESTRSTPPHEAQAVPPA